MDESLIFRDQIVLSRKGVQALLDGAEAKAAELGVPVCIAVVDVGGNLMGFARSDEARVGNVDMCITKAVHGAIRQRPTKEDPKRREADPIQSLRIILAAGSNKATSLGGGFPIKVDGKVVGGIGASGGSGSEDDAIAEAGLKALVGSAAGA
jgi:uncharacterized protein GlcG (DUF336 family)